MPNQAVVNFEDENGTDEARALQEATQALKSVHWDITEIRFFFNQLDIKMAASGVKKQFTKFQALSTILPKEVQDEVKELLSMQATEFENNDAYKQLKDEISRIFGPEPEEANDRALNRVLVGKPSTLARALVNDICRKKLDCECCPAVILNLWKRHLPENVKAGIAYCQLTKDSFKEVCQLADKIFMSTR